MAKSQRLNTVLNSRRRVLTRVCSRRCAPRLLQIEFTAFSFPHLSMPKRGPKGTMGYHHVFNLILWVLYTGMQWKGLPKFCGI